MWRVSLLRRLGALFLPPMCLAESTPINWTEESRINSELVPDAGKVHIDPAKPWGRGLWEEACQAILPWWTKEMPNFNIKTLAVSMLMFISVIAPTLTFGAVYGNVTNNEIRAIETILATSWVGCAYALFAGMPMAIIGSTGPILIMTTTLFSMADSIGVPFRSFYAWVSVWILIYGLVVAFMDLTRFVRLATRFTDDIFTLLIVSIFIMDAIGDPFSDTGLLRLFDPDHQSHIDAEKEDPDYDFLNAALLSLVLGLGTTWFIFWPRSFKFSNFFCSQGIRNSVFDFAVITSVLVWTLVAQVGFPGVQVQELKVPSTFQPSFQCCDAACTLYYPDDCEGQEGGPVGVRPWFAKLSDLNGKGFVPIMAAGPGLLAFLLVYLDNGITWHLINHPSHKLEHGVAYNWDLLLVSACNFVNGLLGLPWLVATTVPCIIHVHAMSEKDPEGNILHNQETRLTGLFAHALVGLCMLFLSVFKLLPVPVLYGVFLFMGLSSIVNIQFWHRILLFFQEPAKYTDTVYTRYMQSKRIHLYTYFEIFFFGLVFLCRISSRFASPFRS